MSSRRVPGTTGQAAIRLLQLVAEALDTVPALKSVATDALRIVELVKGFRRNQDKWNCFAEYVRDVTASIIQSLLNVPESQDRARSNLCKLKTTLEEIAQRLESERALPLHKRLISSMHGPAITLDLKEQLNDIVRCKNLAKTMYIPNPATATVSFF